MLGEMHIPRQAERKTTREIHLYNTRHVASVHLMYSNLHILYPNLTIIAKKRTDTPHLTVFFYLCYSSAISYCTLVQEKLAPTTKSNQRDTVAK